MKSKFNAMPLVCFGIFNALCIAWQERMCNTTNVDFVADILATESPGLWGKTVPLRNPN